MKPSTARCAVCDGSRCRCPLLGLPVFSGVPKAAWECFCKRRVANVYRKGNIIFYDGNRPLGMYFICSGRVKVVKSDSTVHSNIARIVEAPDLLGDRAFLAKEAYRGTGEVMEESRICFLDGAYFEKLFLDVPGVSRALVERLARELGRAEERIVDLAFKTARERLAKYIIEKLKPEELEDDRASFIKFSASRVELAKILDTSPEALCRLLAEFRGKGWISVSGQDVKVINKGRLVQVARF